MTNTRWALTLVVAAGCSEFKSVPDAGDAATEVAPPDTADTGGGDTSVADVTRDAGTEAAVDVSSDATVDGAPADIPPVDVAPEDVSTDVVVDATDSGALFDVVADTGPTADVGTPDADATTPDACGLTMCGGACVDTRTDARHCGACDRACTAPTGGAATCAAGACEATCPAGQANCGGVCRATGASCMAGVGACARTGTLVCAGTETACSATASSPTTEVCDMADNDCDGASDEAPAASSCPARANATSTCATGTCAFTCSAGFSDCDADPSNGCETTGTCLVCTEGWRPIADGPAVWAARCAWTGREMLVWGGIAGTFSTNQGWRYDPVANTWTAMAAAPIGPRVSHHAAWTGSELLIWGGTSGGGTEYADGARYDPATNRWAAMSTTSAPSARNEATAVWTGAAMVVWGGGTPTARTPTDTGGRYSLAADRWEATTTTGAPSARQVPAGVWTGTEMLVWGGQILSPSAYVRLNDGARYSPTTDRWTPMSSAGAPEGRAYVSSVWTGAEALYWGGHANGAVAVATGGRYSPAHDRWVPMTARGAPPARGQASAVWTGTEMIVFGGNPIAATPGYLEDGAAYHPETDTWRPLPAAELGRRGFHCAVWTGSEMIVQGGQDRDGGPAVTWHSGAIYTPPPLPPRPVSPLSGAIVTSRRPTLRWAHRSPCFVGARVQICRDRACTMVEQTLDVAGTSARPSTELAPGVHFWRLFGLGASAAGMPSQPWEFRVGSRSAPVDSSSPGPADFNGDGAPDLAVAAHTLDSNTGAIFVYYGAGSTLATSAGRTIRGPDGSDRYFGSAIANAGDVNGDGYSDLVVGARDAIAGGWRVFVYHGSATGLGVAPSLSLNGTGGGGVGTWLSGAGDVNLDGYADIIVGSPLGNMARVYHGSSNGLGVAPALTLSGPAGGEFGGSISCAGDVNGDSYADVIIGARLAIRAYVHHGGPTGLASAAASVLSGTRTEDRFGETVSGAGDVTGDGYADVVVAAPGAERAMLYRGSSSGILVAVVSDDGNGGSASFGRALAPAGDVDGDGYADVLFGEPDADGSSGFVLLTRGTAGGWTGMHDGYPGMAGSRLGASVAGLGATGGAFAMGAPGANRVEVWSLGGLVATLRGSGGDFGAALAR